MSPTTSVKFVKPKLRTTADKSNWYVFVRLHQSLHAILIERLLVVLLFTATVISDIPFVLTLYVLLTFGHHQWLHPAMQGEFLLSDDGVKVRGVTHAAPNFVLTFKYWLVAMKLSGSWHLLWRDSCDDDVYRRLIVAIKRQS